jgi:hypothetical protein
VQKHLSDIRAHSCPYRATPQDLARYPTPLALCFHAKSDWAYDMSDNH